MIVLTDTDIANIDKILRLVRLNGLTTIEVFTVNTTEIEQPSTECDYIRIAYYIAVDRFNNRLCADTQAQEIYKLGTDKGCVLGKIVPEAPEFHGIVGGSVSF